MTFIGKSDDRESSKYKSSVIISMFSSEIQMSPFKKSEPISVFFFLLFDNWPPYVGSHYLYLKLSVYFHVDL